MKKGVLNKFVASILLLALVFTALIIGWTTSFAFASAAEIGPSIYVDASAKSTNQDGSKKNPYKTVQQAIDHINEKNNPEMSYVIQLAGGVYEFDKTLTIDSNIKAEQIFFTTIHTDDYAVFSGGTRLEGKWQDEGNGIYSIELNRDKKLRTLYVNGRRCYMTSKTISGMGSVGTYNIEAGQADWAWVDGSADAGIRFTKGSIPENTRNQDDIEMVTRSTWNTTTVCVDRVETVGLYDNVYLQMPYGAIAQTLGWGNEYGFKARNIVYNVFEWLDEPGEFYFDKTAHKLYYYPREDENLKKADVVVPNVDTIVEIKGEDKDHKVSNISFQNIIFENTDWNLCEVDGSYGRATNQANAALFAFANDTDKPELWHDNIYRSYDMGPAAVSVTSADNISFGHCAVRHTGNEGITFINDVSNSTIRACAIYDTAASALVVGHPQHMFIGDKGSDIGLNSDKEKYDATQEAFCKNIKVEKSYFNDLAKLFLGCPGITIYAVDGLNFADNKLTNTPYSGISIGWGWWNMNGDDDSSTPGHATQSIKDVNVLRNHFENTMQTLNDGGAIYTLGLMINSKIEKNYIKTIGTEGNGNTKIRGIHMDEGTQYLRGDSNVIDIKDTYACIDCGDWGRKGNNTWTKTYSTTQKWSTEPNIEQNTTCEVIYCANAAWPTEAQEIIAAAGKYDYMVDGLINFETQYEKSSNALIIGLSVGGVVILVAAGVATWFFIKKKKNVKVEA